MKRLITYLTAIAGVSLLSVACSDEFLLKEPKGQITSAALNNPEGIEGKLVAAYRSISGSGMNGGGTWYYDIHNWIFGGIASDNALKGTDAGDQPEHSFIEAYDFTTFNVHLRDKWRSVYWGMARANDILVSLESVEGISATRASQIAAEAKFIRGFAAFEGQKHFREPAYIDETQYDPGDTESTKVPNGGQIWDKIIADFASAAAGLPESQSEVGRATKWAALAFQAKAMIYKGDYAGAKPILKSIIDSGKFTLTDKFEDNFLVATRNNSESIFEIQFSSSSSDDSNTNRGIGLAHPYIAPWGCCGFYQAPQDLIDFFQTDANGLPLLDESWKTKHITNPTGANIGQPIGDPSVDPRLDHTVGRPGILYKDHHIMQVDYIRDLTYAGPYFSKKHVAEPSGFGKGGWGNLTANNYRIMRLAHVILWYAEALVETGDLEGARVQINKLRNRAANPDGFVKAAVQGDTRTAFTKLDTPAANYNVKPYTAPWTDATIARRAVRYESRLETAMEGHRFFDLQRWGVQAQVLNDYISRESKYRIYLQGKSFSSPKNEYYPIPDEAINRSFVDGAATLKQDPNY
jgi:hypothetical protein